jgi:hypothetical protein
MENNESKAKSSISIVLIVLLGITVILGGYLAYLNAELKKQLADCGYSKEQVEDEKDKVVDELNVMLNQYDALQTTNDSMNQMLLAERTKIEKLIEEAKNDKWTIYKLKKEAGTLREIMKGYVRTIDSLNTQNIELRAQNVEVSRKLSETERTADKLRENNEELQGKVKIGARLKALDMAAQAQRVRNNGVHRETNRSGKAEKIRTCFTLDKNDVAEHGKKWLYVRILTPSGKVLAERTDDSNMFDFEGTKGLFSIKKLIDYEGAELDVCMYWDVTGELAAGEYQVEAFCDGMRIGSTSFVLK